MNKIIHFKFILFKLKLNKLSFIFLLSGLLTLTSISPLQTPLLSSVNIDFLPQSGRVATGYTADYGQAFSSSRKFGWISSTTKQPADYKANMRLRTGSTDRKLLSFIQMQAPTDNTVPGIWEYAVSNGSYTVRVSAGDKDNYDSDHQINVEGLPTVTDFRPNVNNKFRASTSTVKVTDGKLTIDASGGINTKMNYITFYPASTVVDVTPPTVSARFAGTLKSANVYDEEVQVFITASDASGSGLARLQYSLDGAAYVNYRAPFKITAGGGHNLKVKAVDANNNVRVTDTYQFSVQPPPQSANIDFLPEGKTVGAGYKADIGLAFDASRKFGWLNGNTKVPASYKGNMRVRSGTGDTKQLSIVQMQAETDNKAPGVWEHIVPNGRYRVKVTAGDNEYYDSGHQINVENLPVISDFAPSEVQKFRTRVGTVQVSDGKLTISANGGNNTKMTHLSFSPATSVTDTVAPITNARFTGSQFSTNVYNNQVKIYITAADEGGSGLETLQYSVNGEAYKNYYVPFVINTPGDYNLKIKAVDGNNNQKVVSSYNFTVIDPDAPKVLSFSKQRLSFTVLKGQQVIPQTVTLATSPPTTSYTFTKTTASWITLPAKSQNLQFGPENINSNMEVGNYQAQITCSADKYQSATLLVDLQVVDVLHEQTSHVNFQDANTVPPLGFIRDIGQAYGPRTGLYQGAALEYGWKKRSDGSVLDLTGNGRNRNTPDDVLLATLLHMQADDITEEFSGVKTEGYWEMEVPNGTYDVTLSVGDGYVNTMPEYHSINIEGVNAINQFLPNGKRGTNSRFKAVTTRVNVTDERLTINADGGTNTKINYASIVPVSLAPYLFWATKTANIFIEKGTSESKSLSMVLGSSNSAASTYSVTASYGAGATGWLTFNQSPTGKQPIVSFNYSAAKNLATGIYKATVKATSGGFTSAVFDVQLNVVDGSKPYVVSSSPANGSAKVSLSTVSIAANNLHIPAVPGYQGGVENGTIDSSTVKLLRIVDGVSSKVNGVVQGTGGGDVISFSPSKGLEANAVYKFIITAGVKSYSGAGFTPYEATFTTAAAKIDSTNILNARFTKVPIPGTQDKKYTSLVIGPDGKFYALRLDGAIERYTINHTDGSLSGQQIITTLFSKYGNRSAIGLVFAPQSTASNLIAYVSHSSPGLAAAPTFDGNISRLQGPNLQDEQLIITKLPRSKRDHLVNGLAFGPDGALYICQGSMSSAGSYDADWQRDEVLLSGAVLRLNLSKLDAFTLPLDVETTSNQNLINNAPSVSAMMSDSTYNPYGSASPLTIYASGVRNAYDLVWHSNGQLYLPTNGSGGGGNSPESVMGTRRPDGTSYAGAEIDATRSIQPQHDWMFRVNPARSVGYYGHPNPLRGEYSLNRGFKDNPLYLPSISADTRYRPAAYDFGLNNSPNGVIEYKSSTFGGILKGKLLVCRFSGGGDIAVMKPGSTVKTTIAGSDDSIYDIAKVTTGSGNNGLVGMSGFGNPLDIVEDVINGNLYVIEYNWNDSPNLTTQITLLRVEASPAPALRTAASYEPAENSSENKKYDITLTNKGGDTLQVKSIRLAGKEASKFKITGLPLPTDKLPMQVRQNSSVSFKVISKAAIPSLSSYVKLIVTAMDDTETEVDLNNALEANQIDFNDISAEIKENENYNIQVYPNPNLGHPVSVQLKNFNRNEPLTIQLYDQKGIVLKTVRATADADGRYSMRMDMANYKSSFYILRVDYSAGFKFAKIVNIN